MVKRAQIRIGVHVGSPVPQLPGGGRQRTVHKHGTRPTHNDPDATHGTCHELLTPYCGKCIPAWVDQMFVLAKLAEAAEEHTARFQLMLMLLLLPLSQSCPLA